MGNKNKKDLSIIVVSYNTKNLLEDCIKSAVNNTKGIKYKIVVVDNNSKDGSVALTKKLAKRHPVVLIENKKNLGFATANNQGINFSDSRYVLLLNSDTIIHDNLLSEMVFWMDKNESVGVVSCSLRNKDGSLQGTGGYFPTLFRVFCWMYFIEDIPIVDRIIKPFHPMHPQSPFYKGEALFKKEMERDWVTGAFFLIRRQVVNEVGLFDEDYFMYTEEVDYCWKVKKCGWNIWYLPRWNITHLGGASSSTSEFPILSELKGIKLFYKKNLPAWQMPILRLLLKGGTVLRMAVFGLLEGKKAVSTYVKAYKTI